MERFVVTIDHQENRSINRTISVRLHTNDVIDTNLRQAITPHERLTATLRFLATGRTYKDLKFTTLISPQSLGKIIPETCEAIFNALKDYCKASIIYHSS